MSQTPYKFDCKSIEDLNPVVSVLMRLVSKNAVFAFDGEMGAGKTTLIGLLCKAMGIEDASSPTYAIVNTYSSEQYGDVYHFDFYRLRDEQEALESGLDELLDSGNICFLEWAERISKLLPPTYVKVGIKQDGAIRNIDITVI